MPSDTEEAEDNQPRQDYTTQEIGQMLFYMQVRAAKSEKKMMSHKWEQKSFARQQTQVNKELGATLAQLTAAINKLQTGNEQPKMVAVHADPPATRGWRLPPSITVKPIGFDPDNHPRLKCDPQRFNGDNAPNWIRKIQKFYNHSFTPLADRLYLTLFLFDDPAADWLSYWEDNVENKDWDGFLLAVKQRFDPDLYEDYVGRLATLRQTMTVEAYQTAFEICIQKVSHVRDSTLTSLFVAGLKPPIKQELLTRRPNSLQAAFALAQQLAAC